MRGTTGFISLRWSGAGFGDPARLVQLVSLLPDKSASRGAGSAAWIKASNVRKMGALIAPRVRVKVSAHESCFTALSRGSDLFLLGPCQDEEEEEEKGDVPAPQRCIKPCSSLGV